MNGPRDLLFARANLAEAQHAGSRTGGELNLSAGLHDCGTVSDQAIGLEAAAHLALKSAHVLVQMGVGPQPRLRRLAIVRLEDNEYRCAFVLPIGQRDELPAPV